MCCDKSGIGFGDHKEKKQSASISHDIRTQGNGEWKIQHKDGLLKLPRVDEVKEKKVYPVHPVFICHHCGLAGHICPYCYELHRRVSHRDEKNSNISWGRTHFIGGNEVKGHIRPRYFDLFETKHGASLCLPRPRNRKLKTMLRHVPIEREGNHNVKK